MIARRPQSCIHGVPTITPCEECGKHYQELKAIYPADYRYRDDRFVLEVIYGEPPETRREEVA